MTVLRIIRSGPLATLQDPGRFGMLAHGISASGPMDRIGYQKAGTLLGHAGTTAIEFTQTFEAEAEGEMRVALAGAQFRLWLNNHPEPWPTALTLAAGDRIVIAPGEWGTFGYLRFESEINVPLVLGSRSTNVVVGLGGFSGRTLRAGDRLLLGGEGVAVPPFEPTSLEGPLRIIWGIHADLFAPTVREAFQREPFFVSRDGDRMGFRLVDPSGVFAGRQRLGLVSEAIVPGDIQILGDGTPIVLMRDHQPTGGYPRIGTLLSAELDRFAQMRPGTEVRFQSVHPEYLR